MMTIEDWEDPTNVFNQHANILIEPPPDVAFYVPALCIPSAFHNLRDLPPDSAAAGRQQGFEIDPSSGRWWRITAAPPRPTT